MYSYLVNINTHKHLIFTVPSPVVEVTSIDTVEFGEAATLECNVTAVRGITSGVDIIWKNKLNLAMMRRVEDVTANIVDNSAVYTDQLVTPPLSVNDSGRVYYCEVSINSTFKITSFDSFALNFIGKYVLTHKYNVVIAI